MQASVPHTKPQAQIAILLLSFGLAANLIYCNFMGHATSFFVSASGFGEIMNPRVLFLSGICLTSLIFVAIPGTLRYHDKTLKIIIPLIASVGTAAYGLAYHQELLNPVILTIVGLSSAGVGYAWIVARLNLLIVRVLGVPYVILCTTAALIVMLIVSALMPLMPDSSIQIIIAMALPFLSATLFELGRLSLSKSIPQNSEQRTSEESKSIKTTFGIKAEARPLISSSADRISLLILLVAGSLFLAIIRALGAYGVWQGSMIESSSSFVFALPNIILVSVVLIGFAYLAIMRMRKQRLELRYIPAFALIIGSLFVVLLQIDSLPSASPFYYNSLLVADVCTHLLYWTVVGSCVEQLRVPSYRVIGMAGAIYSFTSLVWVFLLDSTSLVDRSFITLTTYALLILLLFAIWMLIKKSMGGEESGTNASSLAEDSIKAVSAQCELIATDYKLSPREKEVFTLLVQGQSRNHISEELVLSVNTVKTHIAHIYAKLHVEDRQEMMALLWSYDNKSENS